MLDMKAWAEAKKEVAYRFHHKGIHFDSWTSMVKSLKSRMEEEQVKAVICLRAYQVAELYNEKIFLSAEQVQNALLKEIS
jgi:predicted ATP-grasp superfamily ATP-dependent carboligase